MENIAQLEHKSINAYKYKSNYFRKQFIFDYSNPFACTL